MTATVAPEEDPWLLLVEDDADVRSTIIEVLERKGGRVAAAANGLEALEYLHHAKVMPRLILLDLMMPLMDGRQFRLEQQQVPRWLEVPVILMTAHGNFSEDVAAMGLAGGLRKPFQLAELFALVAPYKPVSAWTAPLRAAR